MWRWVSLMVVALIALAPASGLRAQDAPSLEPPLAGGFLDGGATPGVSLAVDYEVVTLEAASLGPGVRLCVCSLGGPAF
jgi:hypothetical protein